MCELYGFKSIIDIDVGRFEKFCSVYKAGNIKEKFYKQIKGFDPSSMPPCKIELTQHLLRPQYITSIWGSAHLKIPTSLLPEYNGWKNTENVYTFQWFEGEQFPASVLANPAFDKGDTTSDMSC